METNEAPAKGWVGSVEATLLSVKFALADSTPWVPITDFPPIATCSSANTAPQAHACPRWSRSLDGSQLPRDPNGSHEAGRFGADTLQQRHCLPVPKRRQQAVPSTCACRFLLRRRPRIPFDAIGRRRAEPAFDRGNGRRRGLAETHTEPHPTFGDVVSGQAAVPHRRVASASYPARRDRQKTPSLRGVSVARFATSVALPPAYVPDPAGNVLVLIDGRSSSCLPGSPAPLP